MDRFEDLLLARLEELYDNGLDEEEAHEAISEAIERGEFSVSKGILGGGGAPAAVPDTLRSNDTVEVFLAVGAGPIRGLTAGEKSFRVGDTALKDVSGNKNFSKYTLEEFKGQPGEVVKWTLGGQASSHTIGVTLSQGTYVNRTGTVSGQVDHLEVRFTISQLYEDQHSGDVDATDLELDLRYKPTSAPSSAWVNPFGGKVHFKAKVSSPIAKEFRFAVPRLSSGTYDISIAKLNPSDTDSKHHAVVSLESWQEVVAGDTTWPGIAGVRFLAQANSQFSSIPGFWGEYDCRLVKVPTNYDGDARTYSGLWDLTYKVAWTNDPAWVIKDLVEDPVDGLSRYEQLVLDPTDALVASQWWSTSVSDGSGGHEPRFTLNYNFADAQQGAEVLAFAAGAFAGACFDDGAGNISLRVDRPQNAVAIFTPENVADGKIEFSHSDISTRYNDVTVVFNNPLLDYAEDRRRVVIAAHVTAYGTIDTTFTRVGACKPQEAIRSARHRAITATTEFKTATFKTNRLAHGVGPGDPILIGHPKLGYGVTGRLLSVKPGFTNRFLLRDPIALQPGVGYQLRFTVPDGVTAPYKNVVCAVDTLSPRGVSVSEVWLGVAAPAGLPEFPVFVLEQTGVSYGLAQPFRIQDVREVDGSPDLIEVVALNQNLTKWSFIDDGTPIGVQPPILPVTKPPKVSNLAVAPVNVVINGDTKLALRITWDKNPPATRRYEILFSRNGDPIHTLWNGSDTQYDFLQPLPGNYKIFVVAYNIVEDEGEPAEFDIAVGDTTRTVPPPSNLRAKGTVAGHAFGGRDLEVVWDQASVDPLFRDYVVDVMTTGGAVLRTTRVTAAEYRYTFDQNTLDFSGTPSRTVRIRVAAEDAALNLSTTVVVDFANPAPAAPGNPQAVATVEAVSVQFDPAPDPDIAAYQIFGSTTSGFTPGVGNLIYAGLNNHPLIKVAVGTTMYFRACAVDAFGQGAFTAEFGATSVSVQLQDASITANLLADGSVVLGKIAPGAVTTRALAVGDFQNLLLNGDLSSGLEGWTGTGTATVETTGLPTPPTDWSVPRALKSTSAISPSVASFRVADGGGQFVVSAIGAAPSGTLTVSVVWTLQDGSTVGRSPPNPTGTAAVVPGAFTRAYDVFQAPSGAKSGAVVCAFSASASGNYWLAVVSARKLVPSVLIEDGAVTADKVVAGAIQTDKLAAGAVVADKILAGAVTADKIAIGDFDNLIPDPQFDQGGSWDLPAGWVVVARDVTGVPLDCPTGSVLLIPPNAAVAALPVVSVTGAPVDVHPSAGAPTTETVTFSRSGLLTGTSSIPWSVVGTGAHPVLASDFVGGALPTGSVPFAAGDSLVAAAFQVAAEAAPATARTGAFVLGTPAGATIGGATSYPFSLTSATIVPVASLTAGLGTVAVSKTLTVAATATVSLSAPAPAGSSVAWALTGLVAGDVVGGALSGTLTFTTGASSKTLTVTLAAQTLTLDKPLTLTISSPSGVTLGTPTSQTGALQANAVPVNKYALGPDWAANWAQHKAAGDDSSVTKAATSAILTGGSVAGSVPDQRDGVALWSRRPKVGDGRAVFTTRLADTTSPASSTLTEEMFGFYFGMSGKGGATYPADLSTWAATTNPYTHIYRDNCTGAALFFYYQSDASPGLSRVLTLRVYKADGSSNPVSGTTAFPMAQGTVYTWTVAWSGNAVSVTCTDGVTTWTDSITSPLLSANSASGNVGLLVSPKRVVEVGDITLTDGGAGPVDVGVYEADVYDVGVYSDTGS